MADELPVITKSVAKIIVTDYYDQVQNQEKAQKVKEKKEKTLTSVMNIGDRWEHC